MTTLSQLEVESYFERVHGRWPICPTTSGRSCWRSCRIIWPRWRPRRTGPLVDRLGAPEAYAAELRAAAGFEPVPASRRDCEPAGPSGGRRLADLDRGGGQAGSGVATRD